MSLRLRYLRHRDLDGLKRSRLGKLAKKLGIFGNVPPAEDIVFTAAATDICTAAAHGFNAGIDGPFVVTTDDTLPAGLEAGVLYFTGEIDVNTFYLHASQADAAADANRVTISDAGTGIHTIHRLS